MNLKETEAAALMERRDAIVKESETATGDNLAALEKEMDEINAELESRKANEAKKNEARAAVVACRACTACRVGSAPANIVVRSALATAAATVTANSAAAQCRRGQVWPIGCVCTCSSVFTVWCILSIVAVCSTAAACTAVSVCGVWNSSTAAGPRLAIRRYAFAVFPVGYRRLATFSSGNTRLPNNRVIFVLENVIIAGYRPFAVCRRIAAEGGFSAFCPVRICCTAGSCSANSHRERLPRRYGYICNK